MAFSGVTHAVLVELFFLLRESLKKVLIIYQGQKFTDKASSQMLSEAYSCKVFVTKVLFDGRGLIELSKVKNRNDYFFTSFVYICSADFSYLFTFIQLFSAVCLHLFS